MECNALVSIIIPVFNVRPYLAEALDSILSQTYTHLEILVIDDGSTDGSEKICDEYAKKDKRIRVVHQANRGLSGARNVGLDMMSGEIVAFLDSDDAYHPDFVKTMLSTMNRERVDLVVCDYALHNAEGKVIKHSGKMAIKPGIFSREDALRALANEEIDHHAWNKLYKSGLWEQIRYPAGHVYEDIDTTYQIIDRCNKVCVLNQVLCFHRKRPGSIAEICSQGNINDSALANEHFISFIMQNTPYVFTEENLQKSRQAWLRRMISYYAKLSCKKDTSLKYSLRKQVLKLGKETGLNGFRFYQKTVYWMICYCPWTIKAIYPTYRVIRERLG